MKEKIKNFLLKIKKSLCTEIKTPVYKIMLFGILMIILSSICFGCSHYVNETLNEIKSEQIEETPQTESMRIEKDLKFANPTQSDYVNPSNNYNAIYFADLNYVTSGTVSNVWGLVHDYGVDLSPLGEPAFLYPFYCYDNGQSYVLGVYMAYSATNINILLGNIFVISYDGLSYTNVGYLFDYSYRVSTGEIVDTQYYQPQWWIQNLGVAQDNIDFYGQNIPIGYLNTNLSNILSTIPFESTPQQPTLENAPSSLVNTIPSNALTTLPNNLGTKVYDSGSNTFNQKNIFGYQLYFKSFNGFRFDTDSTLINNLSVQFDNFYYAYYIEEIYLVLYGLWDNTEIYYVSDNLVDVVGYFYTKDYYKFNFINTFDTINSINTYYNDYNHVYVDVSLLMQSINTTNNNVFDIANYTDYGFEFLYSSTIDSLNYGNKSHNLDIIYQLDRGFVELFNVSKNMTLNDIKTNTFNEIYNSAFNRGTESGYNTGYDNGYFLGEAHGYNNGYETGYSEGIDLGLENGYQDGYTAGKNAGISTQNPLNPVMDFIADGALVISNVFAFEILPNLTLGTLLLFPLVISLIWFIVKMFMGG